MCIIMLLSKIQFPKFNPQGVRVPQQTIMLTRPEYTYSIKYVVMVVNVAGI